MENKFNFSLCYLCRIFSAHFAVKFYKSTNDAEKNILRHFP